MSPSGWLVAGAAKAAFQLKDSVFLHTSSMNLWFYADQNLAYPYRSEQVDHYHMCINLPSPALPISDNSLAPATASGVTAPCFEQAWRGTFCGGNREVIVFGSSFLLLIYLDVRQVTAAHTNPWDFTTATVDCVVLLCLFYTRFRVNLTPLIRASSTQRWCVRMKKTQLENCD